MGVDHDGNLLICEGGASALSPSKEAMLAFMREEWAISAGSEDSKEFMELKCLEMSTIISSFHVSEFQVFSNQDLDFSMRCAHPVRLAIAHHPCSTSPSTHLSHLAHYALQSILFHWPTLPIHQWCVPLTSSKGVLLVRWVVISF